NMKKFIFFLAWVGIFIMSAIGILHTFVPNFLQEKYESLNIIFSSDLLLTIVSILYFIFCVTSFFALFKRDKNFLVKSKLGTIVVSAGSIKSMVKKTLASEEYVSIKKIETVRKGKKFNLKVVIVASAENDIQAKILSMQEKLSEELKESIGMNFNKIEIKIVDFVTKN
ncbi:MAG: alkaline shock response membrane anchor protein AmaP, partial [Fusobacteriaceae bacterium]